MTDSHDSKGQSGGASSPVGFKLYVQHRDGCHVADDDLAFVLHDGVEWRLDKIARRGGSTLWHRFRCNDTECPAVMLVRWDVMASFVTNQGRDSSPLDV